MCIKDTIPVIFTKQLIIEIETEIENFAGKKIEFIFCTSKHHYWYRSIINRESQAPRFSKLLQDSCLHLQYSIISKLILSKIRKFSTIWYIYTHIGCLQQLIPRFFNSFDQVIKIIGRNFSKMFQKCWRLTQSLLMSADANNRSEINFQHLTDQHGSCFSSVPVPDPSRLKILP